jgi:hypothetical protein
MNSKQKWIVYGVTGAMGIGVLAGGAAAAASAMDLRTTDGTTVPGGVITGRDAGVLDRGNVQMRVTDSSVTVVSALSPTPVAVDPAPASAPSAASVASAASAPAPAPVAPPADSPVSAPSPVSAASPASVASAGSD